MKIIAVIEEPAMLHRILKHLNLWQDPAPSSLLIYAAHIA